MATKKRYNLPACRAVRPPGDLDVSGALWIGRRVLLPPPGNWKSTIDAWWTIWFPGSSWNQVKAYIIHKIGWTLSIKPFFFTRVSLITSIYLITSPIMKYNPFIYIYSPAYGSFTAHARCLFWVADGSPPYESMSIRVGLPVKWMTAHLVHLVCFCWREIKGNQRYVLPSKNMSVLCHKF